MGLVKKGLRLLYSVFLLFGLLGQVKDYIPRALDIQLFDNERQPCQQDPA